MDRKEFLKKLWFNFFKPLILIGVLIYSIRFLIKIFTEGSTERFIAYIFLAVIIFTIILFLAGLIFHNMFLIFKRFIPDKLKSTLVITGKIMDYFLPVILGMMIYHSWLKGGIASIIPWGAFFLISIIDLVKKNKE